MTTVFAFLTACINAHRKKKTEKKNSSTAFGFKSQPSVRCERENYYIILYESFLTPNLVYSTNNVDRDVEMK